MSGHATPHDTRPASDSHPESTARDTTTPHTPIDEPTPAEDTSWTRRHRQTSAAIAALTIAALIVIILVTAESTAETNSQQAHTVTPDQTTTAPIAAPRPVANLDSLPEATTYTSLVGAPPDLTATQVPNGELIHPRQRIAVYARPGGPAIAALPTTEVNNPTWLPVIAREPAWVQVILPSRPNGATGWLPTHHPRGAHSLVDTTYTPWVIRVDRAQYRLRLEREGTVIRSWRIGIGKPAAQTPPGRTFVMASVHDSRQRFSPVILALGTHSAAHQTYAGGPGTTGIHGWPSATVFGQQSSDGCIRVPPEALRELSENVPIGTPVLIS